MKKNKVFKFEVKGESLTKIIVFDNHLTIFYKELNNQYIRWIPFKNLIRATNYSAAYVNKNVISFQLNRLIDNHKHFFIGYPYENKYQNVINNLIETINSRMELLYEKD